MKIAKRLAAKAVVNSDTSHTTKTHTNMAWAFALSSSLAVASGALLVDSAYADPLVKTANAATNALPVLKTNYVKPNDVTSGALLFPSREPGKYIEAPLLHTDVEIDISGPIARTVVTQRFENPSDGWVEGIYAFPLPETSAVDVLKMQIGERFIEGKIKPREEARKIFETAKREGKKTALLEQQRPNLFTNNVANIGPGETIVIQIEYQQSVRQSDGKFSLRFPMVVAPRYNPKPIIHSVSMEGGSGWATTTDPVPDRDKIESPVLNPQTNPKINPVTMSIRLAAGFPIEKVTSHHHRMIEKEDGDSVRVLTFSDGEVPADKDFELTWKAKGKAPNAGLFHESGKHGEYVLAYITPPDVLETTKLERQKREAIFIIDNSGSMAGMSMLQAKASLAEALKRLKPEDRFNVIRFDDTMDVLFPSAVPANAQNLKFATDYVTRLSAQGGTEMLPALKAALIDADPDNSDFVRQVIFLTDGSIGNEQQMFDEIAKNRGRSRVFTVGIGSAPNSFFMNRAAELGRGTFTHVGSTAQVFMRMQELFNKLENPVMTDLKATITGTGTGSFAAKITPNPLPDLYLGEPVVLSAKLPSLSGTLTITGKMLNQPWQVNLPLNQAVKGEGTAKLWARRLIGNLESSRSYTSQTAIEQNKKIDEQIETVAMEFGLVSRLTSLVAVDVTPSRPKDQSLGTAKLPLNLPDGWEFEKVFGETNGKPIDRRAFNDLPPAQKARFQQIAQLTAAAPSAKQAQLVAKKTRQVNLPQTATDADRNILIGFMLMLLAAMFTMLGRFWQSAHLQFTGGSDQDTASNKTLRIHDDLEY